AFWKRGTQLTALLGDLEIDPQGQPRSALTRGVRGVVYTDSKKEWGFEVDRLPAHPLLELAAHLAWLSQTELTGSLRELAEAAVAQHEYFEALARYRLLLRFSRKLEKTTTIVNALDSMSELFRHIGNYDQALNCLEESLEIESSLAYAKDIVENVKLLASDASNPESVRMTMQMRSHAMTINRGCKLGMIAALNADLGNREKAEGFLAEARRLIRSANAEYCEADLLNLQASWDIAEERWEIAQQRLTRAMEIIEDAMQEQAAHDRGEKLLSAGQAMHKFIVPGKRTFLEVGMRSRTSPQAFRALSAHFLAELMLQKSQQSSLAPADRDQLLKEATRWQNQALTWYEEGKDPAGLLVGRLHLAKILTHRQDYATARQLNQTIDREARELHAFEVIWQSLALEGVIQSQQGHLGEAIAAFERAAQEVESVREGIRSEAVRRGFFSSKLEVYEHLIDLYDRQKQKEPATAQAKWDLK
ncbi:MAG: tetratricopeptide repeat protein, partial [Planctomycetaceae bacterium]|nr:tetratricopeptide repeat protein [Planctomycetaceae bacterium]